MEFRCRLGTPSGEVLESVHVADDESRLRRELEDKGLLILDIQPKGVLALPGLAFALPRRRRVSAREFLVFNQELATLLRAGMPLVQSLDILRQRVTSPAFRSALDDVHDRVKAGEALSEAFEAQGALVPGVYTASLLAGERSGGLEDVLRRYVAYVKVVSAVRRKTLSALIYPIILLLLSMIVVGIIVVKVVPGFADFYGTYSAELPAATRVVVAISDVVRSQVLWILLGLAGVFVAARVWLRRSGEQRRLHAFVLRVPVLGPTVRKFATSQLARTLSTLLGGGIPLVNALTIASRSISNRHMAAELEIVAQDVREGQALASAMRARGAFPDVALKMVEVGEATGALQEMLNSLADFYDEEIETNLSRFVTVIEPLMLVIMAIVIAALLLALYLPVIQLSTVVG